MMTTVIVGAATAYVVGILTFGITSVRREIKDGRDLDGASCIFIGTGALIWPIIICVAAVVVLAWLLGRACAWLARRRP